MYCRHCGKQLSDDSKFCTICGNSTISPLSGTIQHGAFSSYMPCILGILFLLAGVIPYLLAGGKAEYITYVETALSYRGEKELITLLYFRDFSSFLTPTLYFFSSIFTAYIGILFLKKEYPSPAVLIANIVTHGVTILYSCVVNLLINYAPATVLSFYTQDQNIIAAGERIVKQPGVLSFYQNNANCRLFISLFVIALVLALLLYKKHRQQQTVATPKSTTGSILMLLALACFPLVDKFSLAPLYDKYYGNVFAAAYSNANFIFNLNYSAALVAVFVCILLTTNLFPRVKRWKLATPTIIAIVVLGIVAYFFLSVCLKEMNVSAELFSISWHYLQYWILANVLLLISLFYWFDSVSKNRIPIWAQIGLPLAALLLYYIIEVLSVSVLSLSLPGFLGLFCISLVTSLFSLLIRANKK